jgi:hypothetical protein
MSCFACLRGELFLYLFCLCFLFVSELISFYFRLCRRLDLLAILDTCQVHKRFLASVIERASKVTPGTGTALHCYSRISEYLYQLAIYILSDGVS